MNGDRGNKRHKELVRNRNNIKQIQPCESTINTEELWREINGINEARQVSYDAHIMPFDKQIDAIRARIKEVCTHDGAINLSVSGGQLYMCTECEQTMHYKPEGARDDSSSSYDSDDLL